MKKRAHKTRGKQCDACENHTEWKQRRDKAEKQKIGDRHEEKEKESDSSKQYTH